MHRFKKQTAKQAKHHAYMMDAMQRFHYDLHDAIYVEGRIPPAWRALAATRPVRKKTRITLRVEEDVVAFFKSMGAGYQQRMNDILVSFVQARLAEIVKEADIRGVYSEDEPRPKWGITEETDRYLGGEFGEE